MCDAGRIRHHLKHNLWRPESTVVFAGYQAYGTLGRVLQDGADTVKLFGETIEVNAKIANMRDMSSHADRDGLDKWIMSFKDQMPGQVFVVHGEDSVTDEFCAWLKENHGIQADAPFSGSVYDLAEGKWLKITEGIPVTKEDEARKITNKYFADLEESVEMLRKVVQQNAGGTNKDIRKFAEQIRALCEKWSR